MMWQHEMQNVLDHFANRSEEAMSQILQRYNELDQMYRYRHRKYRSKWHHHMLPMYSKQTQNSIISSIW
jgi:phosphate uptake regulator